MPKTPPKRPPTAGSFTKDDPRINKNGRPKTGLALAEYVRTLTQNGRYLADMWAAISWGYRPDEDGTSSRAIHVARLQDLARQAEISDRLMASHRLAERCWGRPKEEIEHSGEITGLTRVVHEYHAD